MNPLAVIATAISSIFGYFFKSKEKQAEVVQGALGVITSIQSSETAKYQAAAQIISGESAAGGIASAWRPIMMCIFMALLVSFWFGFTPPGISDKMPPMIERIFDIIQMGIMGYLPARTIEKVITSINLTSLLKTMMGK